MQLPESADLRGLIPPEYPPDNLVTSAQRQAALALEDEFLIRSYLWATAVVTAGFQSSLALPLGFSHFSAGFVALREGFGTPDIAQTNRFTFGGYVLVRGAEQTSSMTLLSIGQRVIPIIINYGTIELHGCPPHPVNGSSTCWASSRDLSSSWTHGILTCRHVVGPVRSHVSLQPSNDHAVPPSAVVADRDECTIDAAVLEIDPSDWPNNIAQLSLQVPSAPGQRIEFRDRQGVILTGSVLRVFYLSTYVGNLFGQRVIADCYGNPGDSGSLLVASGTGRGAGIYMGTIPDGQGGREGIFQDLAQVERFFDLQLYC